MGNCLSCWNFDGKRFKKMKWYLLVIIVQIDTTYTHMLFWIIMFNATQKHMLKYIDGFVLLLIQGENKTFLAQPQKSTSENTYFLSI
jgi:hypothetical protein